MLVWVSTSLILIYLLLVKWISLLSLKQESQRNSSLEDFFLVGRKLKGPILWATILATVINSLAFTAVPGLIYRGGVLFMQMWVIVISLPLLMRVFGPLISEEGRNFGSITQAELYGKLYKSSALAITTAIIGILAVLPFLVIQLSAIAKVTSIASNGFISYECAIAIFTISTALYLLYGGAKAVVWTDVLQGICFFVLLLISAFLFTRWSGGFSPAIKELSIQRPELLSFNEKTWSIFLNNILSWPFAFFLWPQVFQRMLMARNTKTLKTSSTATFLLFSLAMLCIMIIGVMATHAFIGQDVAADTLIAEMYKKHLPLGTCLLVLAVVASGMSTIDSGLLALSATVQRDVLPKFSLIKNQTKGINEVKLAKVLSLFCVSLIALIAYSDFGRGAIAPLVTLGASFATLLLWPLLGIRFGLKITPKQIMGCILLGALAIVLSALSNKEFVGPGVAGFFCSGSIFTGYVFLSKLKASKKIIF